MKNFNLINGNSYEELKKFPDNYFDSVVTDPPYGLGKEPDANELLKAWVETGYMEVSGKGFMGKEWDAFVPQPLFWKEVYRVLKHGGHIVAFYGTRTYDWGVMAMRLAGFEIRDSLQWVYGSGFPKSHNVGKAIEGTLTVGSSNTIHFKNLEGEKKVVKNGYTKMQFEHGVKPSNYNEGNGGNCVVNVNYTTDEAKQWNGWGSALKPAVEPIVLARKPLEKGLSIAENVLKWGTGAINIDASRISTNDNYSYPNGAGGNGFHGGVGRLPDGSRNDTPEMNVNGRFPANLLMSHHPDCEFKGIKKVGSGKEGGYNYEGNVYEVDGFINKNSPNANSNYGIESAEDWKCHEDCPIKIMDEQSGLLKSGKMTPEHTRTTDGSPHGIYGKFNVNHPLGETYGDTGGASRFFYCAKASKSERNFGLNDFEQKRASAYGYDLGLGNAGEGMFKDRNTQKLNVHPTVKPVKLMQYLAKLITPPNGKVLDPFNGSGTTGIACCLEEFNYTGIELSEEYCKISEARINAWNEIDEYEDYKKIIENQEEEETNDNVGKQMDLFGDYEQ